MRIKKVHITADPEWLPWGREAVKKKKITEGQNKEDSK